MHFKKMFEFQEAGIEIAPTIFGEIDFIKSVDIFCVSCIESEIYFIYRKILS